MTSTLQRQDAKLQNPLPPKRACIICCDGEDEDGPPSSELLKPCRICNSDYCMNCLTEMFESATEDHTRMPPKCCTLIQIHTVLSQLTDAQVRDYRLKFEEWITPVKIYCPSLTCSAFISERLIPPQPATPTSSGSPLPPTSGKVPSASLKPVIIEVLDRVNASQFARFFRGDLPIDRLPGFTTVVQRNMNLSIIRENIDKYRSMSDVTADMNLIVSNAIEYNGQNHPVTQAARDLFYMYNIELGDTTDRLVKAQDMAPSRFFPCPKCHIAICTSCRQVEHGDKPCDLTVGDEETAMLATFGCKRCPRCHGGVKKMYGCSHIQCHCGAHWCYYCQRSTVDCRGECDEREDYDEDDDDYDSEMDEMDEDDENNDNPDPAVEVSRTDPPSVLTAQNSNATLRPAPQQQNPPPPNPPAPIRHRIVNLDAGGGRRWAESDYDFGDEPEEEPVFEIWCCNHKFEPFAPPANDGFNRGDMDHMECNRCFDKVVGKKASQCQPPKAPAQKKRAKAVAFPKGVDVIMKDVVGVNEPRESKEKEALECSRCRLLVCPCCRDKYGAAAAKPRV